MESDATCSFCDRPSDGVCRRCRRSFCAAHGAVFCAVCSDPVSGLPSARLYRVTIAGLVGGVALGLWFLIGTPRLPREVTRPASSAPTSQPTVASGISLGRTVATATLSATPSGNSQDYTVKEGDTLASIASTLGTTTTTIVQLNPGLDPETLKINQILHLPAKAP